MTTQEEKNKGMLNLLLITTELLKEADKSNDNSKLAKNLVKQCFFKYMDLADCPFKQVCEERFEEDYECENDHEPIDVRGELD